MAARTATRALASATLILAALTCGGHARANDDVVVDAKRWRTIPGESGPVNYYAIVNGPAGPFIHARYVPPDKTTVLGIEIAEADRRRIKKVRWSWRAVTLPNGGD